MTARCLRRNRPLGLAAVLLLVAPTLFALLRFGAHGAAGVLDPGFGTNGTVTTDVGAFLRAGAASTPTTTGPPSTGPPGTGPPGTSPPPTGPAPTTPPTDHDEATALSVLGDGRIVVAGLGSTGQTNGDDFVVARYGADGTLDPAFGTGGLASTDFPLSEVPGGPQPLPGAGPGVDDEALAVAVQPDGKLVAGGVAHQDFALARYLPDGRLDQSFGSNDSGRVTTDLGPNRDDAVFGVAFQPPDRRIVVCGFTTDSEGRHRFSLLRYLPDGGRDFSYFGGNDTQVPLPVIADFGGGSEEAHAIAIQADGTVIAAGTSVDQAGTPRFVAARFAADGNLDPGFGVGGLFVLDLGAPATGPSTGGARALAIQPDGAILLAGTAPMGAGDSRTGFAVVRLNPNGTVDTGFGNQGVVRTAIGSRAGARGVAVAPDGKILAAGVGGPDQVALARYDPDGALDASFGPAGGTVTTAIGTGSMAEALAVSPDGRPVVAGQAGAGAAGSDFAVARYLADPQVSIGDLRIGEGDRGLTEGRFTVSLSAPAGGLGVTVDYATADGTAVAPGDYRPATGTVHFAPGEIETTLSVMVPGDRRDQGNRLFFVDLTHPAHATLAHSRAAATIVDDEPLVATTIAGGPGLVERLHADASESGAVLSGVCLDPRRAACLDLSALPPGAGPNPRIVDGVTFEVESADGTPAESTQIVRSDTGDGLEVGQSLEIWLPEGVAAAELALTRSGAPVSVEAFGADGLSLGTAATAGEPRVPERLRLPAGPATEAPQQPFAVAATGAFVAVADPANHRVRFVDPASDRPGCPCETALAGNGADGAPQPGGDPLRSPLGGPYGLAPGTGSELYIADTFGHRVLRVATDTTADPPRTTLTVVAGTGAFGFSGDGAAAPSAQLDSPYGVARDTVRGVTYIADTLNHRIRAVAAGGTITTVAGDGTPGYAGDGGPGVAARLNRPRGLALGDAGVVFVADSGNHAVRRLDPSTGIMTTVAGTGVAGSGGDGDQARSAQLRSPAGVAAAGNDLYVADTGNHRIRHVDLTTGKIGAVAGTGTAGFTGDGGDPAKARLSSPFGVAVDPGGDVVIADTGNNRVRIVTGAPGKRTIATRAGNGTPSYTAGPGVAALAALGGVSSVAGWDPGGAERRALTFLADPFTGTVRQIDERGRITTLLGDGTPGPEPGRLAYPFGLATDRASPPRFLYVADTFNNVVRRLDLGDGTVSTVAGTGRPGSGGDGGPATAAALSFPTGVTVDAGGNLYIADTYNARIRRVDAGGIITTVAGTGRLGFSGDGVRATATDLSFPSGVAATAGDPPDLYVADTFNHRIRRIDGTTGLITTVAGSGTAGFTGDGKAARAGTLDRPFGVTVDDAPRPDVYVADTGNGRLRLVDGTSGVLSSFTTGATLVPFDPGDPLAYGPKGVAVARRLTAGEVNPAPGKLVLVADGRGGRATRIGVALADPDVTALDFQTTSFDLGCTAACMTKTITLTNPGAASLAVRRVVITGDQAGDFRLAADGCSRRGIPRGGHCSMRLAFAPADTCPTPDPCRHAVLTIAANGAGGDRQVLLSGSALRQEPDMHTTTTATRTDVQGDVSATDDAAVLLRPGGNAPTGTVAFFLCGPMPNPDPSCPGTRTAIGAAKAIGADGHAVSDAASVNASQGTEYWCWQAEYSGDRFYLPVHHVDTTDECFTVSPPVG
jgi:uncharacterized delta-60 repeat protein